MEKDPVLQKIDELQQALVTLKEQLEVQKRLTEEWREFAIDCMDTYARNKVINAIKDLNKNA